MEETPSIITQISPENGSEPKQAPSKVPFLYTYRVKDFKTKIGSL